MRFTHHHEHRILHSSFSFFAILLAALCWLSTSYLWYESRADTTTSTGNNTVSARVGIIDEGPIAPPGGGGAPLPPTSFNPPPPNPPPPERQKPNLAPSVIAVGETANVIRENGEEPIYVFDSPFPAFSGTVNIPDAFIFFEVRSSPIYRASTIPYDGTNWKWRSSDAIANGDHTLIVRAQSKSDDQINATTRLKFRIISSQTSIPPTGTKPPSIPTTPESSGIENIYHVIANINTQSKKIKPGEPITFTVEFWTNGTKSVTWPLEYFIYDAKGDLVAKQTDTIQASPGQTITKMLYTAPNIPEGDYFLTVKATFENQVTTSGDTFYVQGKPVVSLVTGNISLHTVYWSLFLLGLAFLLIAYFEYREFKKSTRKIQELSPQDLANAHLIK